MKEEVKTGIVKLLQIDKLENAISILKKVYNTENRRIVGNAQNLDLSRKQVQMENCLSSKYLTVSRTEQEKIQEEKKEKKIENNPDIAQNTMQGQQALGEQIMLAIEMKKKAQES